MISYLGEKRKLFVGATKIKKGFVGATKVYSAGNIVTYHVDSGEIHTEEVDSDASCLSFKPTKQGWEFVGWRDDSEANASVLPKKIMGDDPVELYAVFSKDVTLSYNGNGSTSGSITSQSAKKYYNNKNVKKATFTLSDNKNGFKKDDYAFVGWTESSISGTQYKVGSKVELEQDTTFYARWLVVNVTVISNTTFSTSGHIGSDVKSVLYGPVSASDYKAAMINVTRADINVNENTRWAEVGIAYGTCPDPSRYDVYGDNIFVNNSWISVVRHYVNNNGDGQKSQITTLPATLTLPFSETSGNVYLYIGCTSSTTLENNGPGTPTGNIHIEVDPNISLVPR